MYPHKIGIGLFSDVKQAFRRSPFFLWLWCLWVLQRKLESTLADGIYDIPTIHQLNTPLNNPLVKQVTEVEVTDPTHPLFGRRFPVLSISSAPNSVGYVYVTYREYITLRIPRDATNLAPARSTLETKLTVAAVEQLVSVARECEVLCQENQKMSGTNYLNTSKNKSSTKCQKS